MGRWKDMAESVLEPLKLRGPEWKMVDYLRKGVAITVSSIKGSL
jgi:hypothetical protein